MTSFLHWHKLTWALLLWSAYLATWMVLTRSGPVIVVLWWLAGVGLLQLIMQWGRIEPSRRHGPFDPRFGPRPKLRVSGECAPGSTTPRRRPSRRDGWVAGLRPDPECGQH
jgi:hypothetical protein